MSKQEMIEKHGTPADLKVVLGNAIAEGSISYDEAVAAMSKYELEFDNAEQRLTSAHNAQVPEQTMQMRLPQKRRKVNRKWLGTGRC